MTTEWKRFKRVVFGKRPRIEHVQQILEDSKVIAEGWVEYQMKMPIYLNPGEEFQIIYEFGEDELA